MSVRRLLLSLAVCLCTPVYAQPSLTAAQDKVVKEFINKLYDENAWTTPGANTSPLDLIVLVAKQNSAVHKTIDGKLEFSLPDSKVRVNVVFDAPSYYLPLTWPASSPAGGEQRTGIGDRTLRDLNASLDNIGAPCRVDRGMRDSDLRCSATPIGFLQFLADIEVLSCPADKANECVEAGGTRVLARHAAKRDRRDMRPGPVEEALAASIEDSIRSGKLAARDADGRKVTAPVATVTFREEDSESVFTVMPRAQFEQMRPESRATWVQLGVLKPSEVKARYARLQLQKLVNENAVNQDLQTRQKAAMHIAATFRNIAGKDAALAAIKLYGFEDHAVCTIGDRSGNAGEKARLGVLASPGFRKWIEVDVKNRFSHVMPDLDALYAAMQKNECTAVIDTAANVAKLAEALNRDHAAISLLDTPFDAAFFADLDAKKAGYRSQSDRQFALTMGVKSQLAVDRLHETGLNDAAAVEAARARMRATRYADGGGDVLQFRYDEIEAAQKKSTATAIYNARVAAAASAQGIYRGMTDEQAAYKALAQIKTIRDPNERKLQTDNCTKLISLALSQDTAFSREVSWQNARHFCVEGAPR